MENEEKRVSREREREVAVKDHKRPTVKGHTALTHCIEWHGRILEKECSQFLSVLT